MRVHSFITLFSLVTSAFAVFQGSGLPPSFEIENRDLSDNRFVRSTPTTEAPNKRLFNAERLARGLPPLPPRSFHSRVVPGHAVPRFLPVEAPAGVARRAQNSPTPPLLKTGIIKVESADGTQLGYVSNVSNGAFLFTKTSNINDALKVTINTASTGGVPIDLAVPAGQGNANFPFLGGVTGPAATSDDLAPGSYNYGFITGTNQTPPNSPPAAVGNKTGSRNSESAVWNYSSATKELTFQWVNTNGAKPATYTYYRQTGNYLGFTGDIAAFQARFGSLTLVKFYFQEV